MPLSLDGREGRKLQSELIEGVLKEMAQSRIVTLQYQNLSPAIHSRWMAFTSARDDAFVALIMNEFASVLDAEGIRAGDERAERYAQGTAQRPAWLMALPTVIDRRFLLEVHRRYRKLLGEMNTLSVDQMVADFSSFLDSNRWDRVRTRTGYDALFVDELQLFTSIERQMLHKLLKPGEDAGTPKRPAIFMANDLKQSPRDTFTHYGEPDNKLFTAATRLQNSDLIRLEKVFRYTPQIAELLADIDASFPAIDIPGVWEAYAGEAKLVDGEVPQVIVLPDDLTLFQQVFDAAQTLARGTADGGRRVAVLCVNPERFDAYLEEASRRYEGRFLALDSRVPSSELRHAARERL